MIRVILKGDGVLKGDGNHVGRRLEMRWLKGDQPHLIKADPYGVTYRPAGKHWNIGFAVKGTRELTVKEQSNRYVLV